MKIEKEFSYISDERKRVYIFKFKSDLEVHIKIVHDQPFTAELDDTGR